MYRKSKISARAKQLAMDCECPIWMYGRIGNNLVPRQSTGFNDLGRDLLLAPNKSAVHIAAGERLWTTLLAQSGDKRRNNRCLR